MSIEKEAECAAFWVKVRQPRWLDVGTIGLYLTKEELIWLALHLEEEAIQEDIPKRLYAMINDKLKEKEGR